MSTVEIDDLEQIVQTVRREHEFLRGGRKRPRIGGFQRTAFVLLQVVAYSIPIALALAALLGWLDLDSRYLEPGSLLTVALLGWAIVGMVLMVPLLLLNLPLVVTAWRQHRLIAKRGLMEPTFPAWQLKARWLVLAVTVVAGVVAVMISDLGWFLLVMMVVTIPFLLLMMRSFLGLAERNLDLLRDVEELKEVLEDKLENARRTAATHVDLSHSLAIRVSQTATGILSSQRLRAIGESMNTPHTEYSVTQSAAVREWLAGFAPEERLQLLERVQGLATNHEPEGARRDDATGRWIWNLGEPRVELIYEVAEQEARILLRDARPLQPAGSGDIDDGSG